jgi:hypothetical protein
MRERATCAKSTPHKRAAAALVGAVSGASLLALLVQKYKCCLRKKSTPHKRASAALVGAVSGTSLLALLVQKYKCCLCKKYTTQTRSSSAGGSSFRYQFTCFASTKVQMLPAQKVHHTHALQQRWWEQFQVHLNHQFTCFTRVQKYKY